ncbi:hypothetical protein PM082_000246 [Marasmius tenuissimus]|nr:hypothetical protein PM082_000246 [Marasmius tenuissimus]
MPIDIAAALTQCIILKHHNKGRNKQQHRIHTRHQVTYWYVFPLSLHIVQCSH